MPNAPAFGSLVACHTKGVQGKAIRWGERLRFRSGAFWSHFAIIDNHPSPDPNDPYVIQAEGSGVTGWITDVTSFKARKLSEVCIGGIYEIVDLPAGTDPLKVLAFAHNQVGKRYGWLSILNIAIHILAPKWLPLPSIRSDKTWICSALAGESLRLGGWLHDWPDIYDVVPSELYAAIKNINIHDIMDVSFLESETINGASSEAAPNKRTNAPRKSR